MKKVSIIVPVYNAEKTLAGCLGNLVHQTLADIEIIAINDASTDGSLRILQDCESQFPDKMILINAEQNTGPGGARNIGLSYASGEYLGFVDADDLADTRMYEKLYTAAIEGGYDMVDGGYLDALNDRAIVMTGDDCTGELDDRKRSKLIVGGGFLWSRLFKRSLFEDPAPLRFREGVILEDADVMTYLFAVTKSVGNVKEIIYHYRTFEDSASKLVEPAGYVHNITEAMQAVYDRTYALPGYAGIRDAVEYEILQMYSWGINLCIKTKRNLCGKPAEDAFDPDRALRDLRHLKDRLVTRRKYNDNSFVREKIPKADLKIIEEVDGIPPVTDSGLAIDRVKVLEM
ncbi:MAG: glycosyltransferase [Lachnospiraceae bacterium]|nr:glycosyltransferase [Lachnospiraceae bacterium]